MEYLLILGIGLFIVWLLVKQSERKGRLENEKESIKKTLDVIKDAKEVKDSNIPVDDRRKRMRDNFSR